MGRDVKGVAVVSVMFGLLAIIVSGSASSVFIVGLFIGGGIWLFYERQ